MSTIWESRREVPVIEGYDVAVIGGGIAGVAAALASARLGARTCLIEKYTGLGGLATLGNVVIYLPICDGEGYQVIGGLGEELLHLASADGYDGIPNVWNSVHTAEERKRERYMLRFNAASYMLALEKILLNAGVSLWYDTAFLDVTKSDESIQTAVIQNKSGRLAILAQMFIDASGDADVCHASGEETVSLDTNVRSNWFFYHDRGDVHRVSLSEGFSEDGSAPEPGVHGYSGVYGKDVSRHVIDSHQLLRERFAAIKDESPDAFLVNIPTMPSFRMTRRLQGEVVLSEKYSGIVPDDLVGLCPSWRESGIVYGIPYRSLRGARMKNMITAGRCISASGRLWDMTRVIPICALTGEIAGTAAGLACQSHRMDLHTLPLEHLGQQLLAQGNILDGSLIRGY